MRVILPRQVALALVLGARALSIFVPVALVGYLVWVDAVVSGELSATLDIGRQSPYISPLHPGGRLQPISVDAAGVTSQTIIQQPVYFDVRVPRGLRELEVRLTYQNLDQLLVEAGPQVSDTPWTFQLGGVEHQALDFLLQDTARWSSLREGEVVLLQRDRHYDSVAAFLANPPPRDMIATYRYDLPPQMQLPDYVPKPDGAEVTAWLAGSHRFYTYAAAGEGIELNLEVQDTNRTLGADPLTVVITQNGTPPHTASFPDDGNTAADGQTSQPRSLTVTAETAAGVLQVALVASPDLVLRRLATNLDYLAFTGEVRLATGQESAPALTLTTDATALSATAQTLEGLQTIQLGSQPLALTQTHERFSAAAPSGVKSLQLPRRGVSLTGNGTVAFSSAAWFNPDVISLGSGVGFDADRIRTIIARYPQSRVEDGWRTTTVRFPLLPQHVAAGAVKVALSLPELNAGDQGVRIRRIGVRLLGEPLALSDVTRKFWSLVGSLKP